MSEQSKPHEATKPEEAARDYVNGTIFTDEAAVDDETLIKNIRFMAFLAGAQWQKEQYEQQ